MEVITLASLISLGNKVTAFLKSLTNKDWNAVITQLVHWGGMTIILVFAAHASIANQITLFDGVPPLKELDGASLLLAGMSLGSLGSVLYDFKKARDNTDGAVEPPLIPQLVKPKVVVD